MERNKKSVWYEHPEEKSNVKSFYQDDELKASKNVLSGAVYEEPSRPNIFSPDSVMDSIDYVFSHNEKMTEDEIKRLSEVIDHISADLINNFTAAQRGMIITGIRNKLKHRLINELEKVSDDLNEQAYEFEKLKNIVY